MRKQKNAGFQRTVLLMKYLKNISVKNDENGFQSLFEYVYTHNTYI